MKKSILFTALLLLAVTGFTQNVKKISMKQLLHLADTSQAPLVINFWASWCGPCIREIPWFEKNINGLPDKPVKLILVSLDFADEYPTGIAAFVKKNGYHSDIYWLNEPDVETAVKQVDKSWDSTIPVTWMINNKKKYRKFYGQQLPEARLLQELENLTR